MELRGLLGLAAVLLVAFLLSNNKRGISWRTVGVALAVQVGLAAVVLRWDPGRRALQWLSEQVAALVGFTDAGTEFVFGPLLNTAGQGETIFALQVLPVIVFLGALVGLLFYLRIIQFVTHVIGGAIAWLLRVTKIEAMFASTVIFLGQSEAPLMISPYLPRLTRGQVFTVMTGGFAAVAGSTLVGYSLLGAPLEYLLAATFMNAPAGLMIAKLMWPDDGDDVPAVERARAAAASGGDAAPTRDAHPPAREHPDDPEAGAGAGAGQAPFDVLGVRDEESSNVIDALGRGALAGGRIAVTVGALLIAFVAVIAMADAILSGIGGWFGYEGLTFERLLGWVCAPVAWLLGVPWSEATQAGGWIGEKTVLNEFFAYASFGPEIASLTPITVVVVTFALAGFANFSSIAIQVGTYSSLQPELRPLVAKLGLRALLAGTLANLANAAVAGVLFVG